MKEKNKAVLKLALMLAAFVVVGGYLARVYVDATSPSSVKVTVYKIELMADRSDAMPLVVFADAAGREIDLVRETGDFMVPSGKAAGIYKRIRLTVKNGIKMSVADAKDNPCGGAPFTDTVFPLMEDAGPDAEVPLYFASDEDGGGAWVGSQITNLLIRPMTFGQDRSTEVKLRFVVADTLFCLGDKVARRAPWSAWPEMTL